MKSEKRCCKWIFYQVNEESHSLVKDDVERKSKYVDSDKIDGNNRGLMRTVAGVLLAFIGGCSLGLADMFSKLADQHGGINPIQQVAAKSFVVLLISTPVVYKRVSPVQENIRMLIFYIFRNVIEHTSYVSYMYSFIYAGLATATAIVTGSSPIFSYGLSRILLKENITIADIISIITNTIGIVLVTAIQFEFRRNTLGCLLAFLTAVLMSSGGVWTRMVRDEFSILPFMFYSGLTGTIILLPMALFTSETSILSLINSDEALVSIAYLIGMIVFNIIYSVTLFVAFTLESAGKVIVVMNIQIVIAFIADITVFNLTPSVLTILGAVLISITSIALIVWKGYNNGKKTEESEDQE